MHLRRSATMAALCLTLYGGTASAASITYLGTGLIPGDAADLSGLTGTISGSAGTIAQNLLGAFGSGIAYTGSKNVYVMVNDRGYSDGITTPSYQDRMQIFEIVVNPTAKTVTPKLLDTRLLTDENGQVLLGQTAEFNPFDPVLTRRFDPEGVRVGRNGHIFISDEYGPYISEFDQTGRRIRKIAIPPKFAIANQNFDGTAEIRNNKSGRQSNRGMEGLAISPDGSTLFGLMQNGLLQDNAVTGTTRDGVYTRLLRVELATGITQEYVYQLENGRDNGVNEILAINDHEFLVVERDGRAGAAAQTKKIYWADLTGATDVSARGTTETNGLPKTGGNDFVPVKKAEFLDLLKSEYGLAGASFPEKIEGLAWGPTLADGQRLLLVTSDNDLIAENPTRIFAFAVSADSVPGYQAQTIDVPFANLPLKQLQYTINAPVYNRSSRTSTGSITITNTGAALSGPLQMVLADLENVALMNKAGDAGKAPYVTVSTSGLAAGASVTVPLQFTNPANFGITFRLVFVSGTF